MAVQDAVDQLLQHSHEMIRKKAVIVMLKFNKIQPIPEFEIKMKRALCDRDASVMASSLNYFLEESKKRPHELRDLVNSMLVILKQVIDHRLPRDFDYHRMPGPWIQARILEIMANIGKDNKESSEKMYETLQIVIKKADDMGTNMGYALVY